MGDPVWLLTVSMDILERPGSHTGMVCHCLTDKIVSVVEEMVFF